MKKHNNCPFCGNGAGIDTLKYAGGKPGKFRAQCQGCNAATAWYETEEKAWKAWDTRLAKRRQVAGRKKAK